MLAALLIFAATYLVMAVGRLPGFRVDRTGAAIIGAALMIGTRVLTVQEAYAAINYDTIMLLFGMMIVVANLRLSGFFTVVSAWVVEHAHRPLVLLSGIVAVAGVFSAFFVNDTMCLVLTPLVLEITGRLGRRPVPYLLAVAMGSNVGSVATVTGNPQNMMIAGFSQLSYRTFAAALAPVALVGLVLTVVVIAVIYRDEFRARGDLRPPHRAVRVNRLLLWKSVAVSAGMIAMFFAGWPVPQVAVLAGALLLVTRRIKPEKVYREIDWSLLVMFIGLFIVIAGLEKTPAAADLFAAASRYHLERTAPTTAFAALLSNLVSNVPAVLVFKGFVAQLPDRAHAWLTLAMSSTLAGNLTVLGSVANLIVIERARPEVRIGFWEYAKAGVPLTVLTLAAGVWMLN
ncbi:MAG TPA: anion transporter [Candidatus Acidoferrales bacterium]|nr:anion transporter [Candidatus Acidoferrales bacterium]